jgi:hypothetical protein
MPYAVQLTRENPTDDEDLERRPASVSLIKPFDEGTIDALVQDIKRLHHAAGVRFAILLGQLIIERIFAGDLARWQERGRKDISFRRLARHAELPFGASTLSRAVGIYMLSKRRKDLLAFEHIGSSHLHEVAGLHWQTQDRLLDRAEAEKWSVRRLRREIVQQSVRRTRKRSMPQFARHVWSLASGVAEAALLADIERIDLLSDVDIRVLADVVRRLIAQAETLEGRLSERLVELDPAGDEGARGDCSA